MPHSPTSRRRVSARTALLWGLVAFVAAQIGLAMALADGQQERRDPEYQLKLRRLRERLAEAPERPLLLVLGSSRTETGLVPTGVEVLPGSPAPLVFNFALAGSDPGLELLTLRRLQREGIRPRWLAVEVLPPFLSQEHVHLLRAMHLYRLTWSDLPGLGAAEPRPLRLTVHWFREHGAPWHILQGAATNYVLNRHQFRPQPKPDPWRDMDGHGWVPTPVHADPAFRDFLRERERNGYQGYLREFRISPGPDRALRNLLGECRSAGLPVVLYTMPESPVFRSWYPHGAEAVCNAYFDGLGREYGVAVVDARRWLDEGPYLDGHHLMAPGAEVFSRRFGHHCLAPLVRGELPAERRVAASD